MTDRKRRVEIHWVGDETREQALLAALSHKNIEPVRVGVCERWMRVAERKAKDGLKAPAGFGRVLQPAPCNWGYGHP